jgi:hypothetical protein
MGAFLFHFVKKWLKKAIYHFLAKKMASMPLPLR